MCNLSSQSVRDLAFRLNQVPVGGDPLSAGPRYLVEADLCAHIEGVHRGNVGTVIDDLVRTYPHLFQKGPFAIFTW